MRGDLSLPKFREFAREPDWEIDTLHFFNICYYMYIPLLSLYSKSQ